MELAIVGNLLAQKSYLLVFHDLGLVKSWHFRLLVFNGFEYNYLKYHFKYEFYHTFIYMLS